MILPPDLSQLTHPEKNALILAAPAAGGILGSFAVVAEVAGAVVAFCMLSSATYLLNDIRDIDQDRRHHRKRNRPIASGALPVRWALALAIWRRRSAG